MQVYTYVLAMEVLDNLPHDCVTRDGPGGAWQEAVVRGAASGSPALAQRPLQDPLIEQALHAADWGRPAGGALPCSPHGSPCGHMCAVQPTGRPGVITLAHHCDFGTISKTAAHTHVRS